MAEPRHAGGCQCGAVRFAALGAPLRVSLCHCRMCQRATGNAFAPLAEFAADKVDWTGTPATFRSSDKAERGFCAACGTPLFYRFVEGDTVEFMIGAFREPGAVAPEYHYGIESRVDWLDKLAALPGYRTGGGPFGDNPEMPVSHQAGEAQ